MLVGNAFVLQVDKKHGRQSGDEEAVSSAIFYSSRE